MYKKDTRKMLVKLTTDSQESKKGEQIVVKSHLGIEKNWLSEQIVEETHKEKKLVKAKIERKIIFGYHTSLFHRSRSDI